MLHFVYLILNNTNTILKVFDLYLQSLYFFFQSLFVVYNFCCKFICFYLFFLLKALFLIGCCGNSLVIIILLAFKDYFCSCLEDLVIRLLKIAYFLKHFDKNPIHLLLIILEVVILDSMIEIILQFHNFYFIFIMIFF
jgi:hypothetical protein